MEEIVTAECCPETLHRVKESGGRVVCEVCTIQGEMMSCVLFLLVPQKQKPM